MVARSESVMKNRVKHPLAEKSWWRHIQLAIKRYYIGNHASQIKSYYGTLWGSHVATQRLFATPRCHTEFDKQAFSHSAPCVGLELNKNSHSNLILSCHSFFQPRSNFIICAQPSLVLSCSPIDISSSVSKLWFAFKLKYCATFIIDVVNQSLHYVLVESQKQYKKWLLYLQCDHHRVYCIKNNINHFPDTH